MRIRREVVPFLMAVAAFCLLLVLVLKALGISGLQAGLGGVALLLVLDAYLLYFFRDPERHSPEDVEAIVAGADGTVLSVIDVFEPAFLKTPAVRISIFLSLFNVHVNRSPIVGCVRFAAYYPGKRFFTFQEKSSEFNQHSSILIQGSTTSCLVNQIVGPVARRVVYWLAPGQNLAKGERIGMMKFGSRLDMYFPRSDVEVTVSRGQTVRAGETVVARLKQKGAA